MDDFWFSGTVSPVFDSSSRQQDTEAASFPSLSKYNMLPAGSKDFLILYVQYPVYCWTDVRHKFIEVEDNIDMWVLVMGLCAWCN